MIPDLFEGNVAISDQSARAQRNAMKRAFEQVLVKVSGNAELLSHPAIKAAGNRASELMRSYQFEMVDGQLFYQASFDKQQVQRIIRSAGFPIWGSRRPDTIAWIAVEEPQSLERTLINELNLPEDRNTLVSATRSRGIALTFPVLDLTDLQQVSVFDVWGRFDQVVHEGSSRYAPDYVLSARVYYGPEQPISFDEVDIEAVGESDPFDPYYVKPDEVASLNTDGVLSDPQSEQDAEPVVKVWHADWSVIHGETVDSGSAQAPSRQQALTGLVNTLADLLASRFAIDPTQSGNQTALITLNDVSSLSDYVVAQQTLNSLSAVIDSRLVSQSGSQAIFQLSLIGDLDDLNNALRLEDKILPVLDQFGRELTDMQFRWVR